MRRCPSHSFYSRPTRTRSLFFLQPLGGAGSCGACAISDRPGLLGRVGSHRGSESSKLARAGQELPRQTTRRAHAAGFLRLVREGGGRYGRLAGREKESDSAHCLRESKCVSERSRAVGGVGVLTGRVQLGDGRRGWCGSRPPAGDSSGSWRGSETTRRPPLLQALGRSVSWGEGASSSEVSGAV